MNNRYNTTLGFYEPSVFHIYVRGKGKLCDLKNWDTQQASTFLHENIHFLQDITTAKGLQNFYIIGEYLRIVTKLVKGSHNKIKLPIDPFKAGYNVGNNWIANFYTQGDIDYSAISYKSYKRDQSIQLNDDVTGKQLPIGRIIVDYVFADGSVKALNFGNIQIMEGMAKMIQESVYTTPHRTSPYNPYYVAIDVANDIIPGLGNNKLTMIAMFDYALQFSNPGWAFVNYIEEKKNQGYNAKSLTYSIVYQDIDSSKVQSHTQGVVSLKNGYVDLMKMAKGVFTDYTGGIWLFKNQMVWYNTLLERGKFIREKLPHLFVSLALGGDIRVDGLFNQILSTFGTPIVTNSKHDYEFHRPDNIQITRDELMHVYAMMQIHQVFYSDGQFTCPLRKYCQQQPCGIKKQRVDVRCVKAPWERIRRYNRCLFNIWWKFKGFKDIEFV